MKRAILLALVAAASCGGPEPEPRPPAPSVSVTLKGVRLPAAWIGTDPDRREAPRRRLRPLVDEAVVLAWPRDRYLHHHSDGGTAPFDVAWLAADGKILETAALPDDSERGISSAVEARTALLLPEGWLRKQGVKIGDRARIEGEEAGRADDLPEIRIGEAALRVEASATFDERMRGLMHRRRLSAGEGMLFLYGEADLRRFWMGHCHLPLDIAFFDAKRRLINVVEIDPYPDPEVDPGTRAVSDAPALYVVETNKGWFKKQGLSAGALMTLPAPLVALEAKAER